LKIHKRHRGSYKTETPDINQHPKHIVDTTGQVYQTRGTAIRVTQFLKKGQSFAINSLKRW